MNTIMVIPTYWTGSEGKWQEGDSVYDHPTPLNENGTLKRTLDSIHSLEDKEFSIVIIGAVTNPIYLAQMEEKVRSIILSSKLKQDIYLFTNSHLNKIKQALGNALNKILSFKGYSNIRNLCLFVPYILDADVAVLIDDDEIFEDPKFIEKAKEFIGKRFYGNTIDGVAGYYLNEDNEYYDKVNIAPWMTYWDRFGGKREAFDKIIGGEPRLKKTPFAFGGAMVIHRNLMRIVPFDPNITRGEDTDYVINARIFGFNFYLDNTLAIKHLPPPKHHPVWKRFREDIYRFLYDKSKFETQYEKTNLREINPEDFDPYPGEFMKPDLEDKIFKTNIILALNYLADNDIASCKETIKNIYLAKYDAKPHYNTFETYLDYQKKWRIMLKETAGFGNSLKEIITRGLVTDAKDIREDRIKHVMNKFNQEQHEEILNLISVDHFPDFSRKDLRFMFSHSNSEKLSKDEYVFRAHEKNNDFFIVLSGMLKVIKENSENSNELLVTTLEKGDHFNETAIFFDFPHSVSVKAVEDSEIIVLKRETLLELLHENSELSTKILWFISRKLSERLMLTTQKFSDSKAQYSDVSDHMEE